MNRPTSVMQSLLWKDIQTVKPLVVMAFVGILLFNFVAFVSQLAFSSSPNVEAFAMIWILMPNLVALGAPAMLVGGEEESGTLSWLRTLPIRWQHVVRSKFLVAAGAVALTWLAASIVMLLIVATNPFPSYGAGAELSSLSGVLNLFFFTALLLTLSFVCAYALRSPVAGLLALVPLIFFTYVFAATFGNELLSRHFAVRVFGESNANHPFVSYGMVAFVVTMAFALLTVFWFLQRWLGGGRLTRPIAQQSLSDKVSQSIQQPYRPPMINNQQRPSQLRALHWQQYRQIAWPFIGLMVLGIGSAMAMQIADRHTVLNHSFDGFLTGTSPLGFFIAAIGLGSLVFYGDNVNRRRVFFSDRGISPGRVWWTRMMLPLAGCLVLTAVVLLIVPRHREGSMMAITLPMVFVFGQAVSMWMSRPVLSLFAAPVYAAFFGIVFGNFFQNYQDYWWTSTLVVPVLLLTTWWLCDRWLTGKVDNKFHARMIGVSFVAVLLPIVAVLGYRVASTPAMNGAWRARAFAASVDSQKLNTRAYWTQSMSRGIQDWGNISNMFDLGQIYESRQVLEDAMETEFGFTEAYYSPDLYTVTNDDIAMILDPRNVPWELTTEEQMSLRHMAARLVLTRIQRARQTAAASETVLFKLKNLYDIAELPEEAIVRLLTTEASRFGDDEAVAELVSMIPSAKLRKQSRQRALLSDWRQYQDPPPKNSAGLFSDTQLAFPGLIGIEERRSRRYVDELVQLVWEQLDSGLPAWNSEAIARRNSLAYSAVAPQMRIDFPIKVFRTWTSDYEQSIRDLRKRYGAEDR